jgi:hypothetical protein
MVQAGPGKKQDQSKTAEGMVQAIEYLPSKHKAPSSNPSNTTKKNQSKILNIPYKTHTT